MNLLRRLKAVFDGWKQHFTDGPEWRMISATYLLGAFVAGVGAFYAPTHWLTVLDAMLSGWCLHGALSTRMMKVYRDIFEDTRKELRKMQELNTALLEDKVRVHLAEMGVYSGPDKSIN
jgi:hypothetical protein